MSEKTPMKAIRAKCLDCCCGSFKEVDLCPAKECALYPYRFGKRPTTPQNRPLKQTHEEIEAILEAEKHPRYLALWQFLLLTGCRRSEAMALTWLDIDLAAGRITIKQTKNRRPKIVFISSQLQELLEDLGPGVGKLWPWSLRQATRRFQLLAQSLNIVARLHDLRHSYCSYAVMSGIDLYTVGKLAGHRDIKSTQRYAHLAPSHMEEAQAKLANALNLRQVNPKR